MKFLIIGLGSMGKRRIRNLQHLQAGEIIGFELREDRRKEVEETYGIKTFGAIDRALSENPDAIIISTPPDRHHEYAMLAAKNHKHFFTEANITSRGMADLIELCKGKNIVAAPSCTMRFHPAIKKIKELVDAGTIGPVLTFIYHVGMYLPDWHPWEDYRTFYVSKKETGACREIVPYELGWITWVLGDVTQVSCMRGKLTTLETDIDDAYQLLMKFETGTLGHMLVDAISRVPYRSLRLISEEGVITWEWGNGIRVYTAKDKTWKEYPEYPGATGTTMKNYDQKIKEEPYIEEMKRFVDMVAKGTKNQYTLLDDAKILHILESAEKSSDTGNHINLLGVSGE